MELITFMCTPLLLKDGIVNLHEITIIKENIN
jgi:hypothetical protein